MIAVTSGNRGTAWWKPATSNKWTAIAVNQSFTTAIGATRYLRFGSLVVTAGTTTSYWTYVASRPALDDGFTDGVFTASEVTGYPLPFDAGQVPLTDGTLINLFGRGGPFSTGDTFDADTTSSTGVARMFDTVGNPSPRENFQSGTVAVGASISAGTLEYAIFDCGVGYNSRVDDILAVFVIGSELYEVLIDRWDGAAYQNMVTHPCYSDPFGTNPSWIRTSSTDLWITPNGTNGIPRYFAKDELAGHFLEWKSGAAFTAFAEIAHNTEGQFSTATDVKQMAIQLANLPTGASAPYVSIGTSGSGANSRLRVHWRDSLSVFNQSAIANRYYRVQWRYNGLRTSGKAGKIIICRAMPFFRQPSQGEQFGYISNDREVQLPYGFTRARREAPMGRTARIPFRQIMANQSRYSGGTAINTFGPGSTPREVADSHLEQAISALKNEGLVKGAVYISQIELSSDFAGATKTVHSNRTWIYGTMGQELTTTQNHGQRFGNSSAAGNHSGDFDLTIKERV
jgi:hypothetical protein